MAGTSMSKFALEYGKLLNLHNGTKPQEKNIANKYNAKKTKVGSLTFDSKIEASFYKRLLWLLKAKKIQTIELQPVFILQHEFVDNLNKKHSAIHYRADFKVVFKGGREIVYDTKGYKTEVYRIKKKLFLKKYPQMILEEVYDPESHPLEVA